MDELYGNALYAMRDGKTHTFQQILEKVNFSHNTLRLRLDKLVDQRLINREKIPREARGRPTYVYSVNPAGRRASVMLRSGVDGVVVLPFSVLGKFCRFEKGGFCKRVRVDCEAQICPKIGKWP